MKLSISEVRMIALDVGIDSELVVKIVQQANEYIARLEGEKEQKATPPKRKFIFVPVPIGNALIRVFKEDVSLEDIEKSIKESESGWVLQVLENNGEIGLFERIRLATKEFNDSPKGRKVPVKTLAEAFEFVPARYFKAQGIWVKTKEPVLKVHAR